jgi:hypothetical protein
MTQHAKKTIRDFGRKIERDSSVIEQRIPAGAVRPDVAIVSSAAKYRGALERLAKE